MNTYVKLTLSKKDAEFLQQMCNLVRYKGEAIYAAHHREQFQTLRDVSRVRRIELAARRALRG